VSNSYYIVPIYNKEEMILNVLDGIKKSHSGKYGNAQIICVLDGCVDSSEEKIKEFIDSLENKESVHILYQNDVHEIKCLNTGLEYVSKNLNPNSNDLIFNVQDDVILDENSIDLKFIALNNIVDNLGYISMRIGLSLSGDSGDIQEYNFLESEFGAWNQLGWNFHKSIPHKQFVTSQIAVRSPTCVMWKRYDELGFFDEDLAPAGFDCHDMSIRMEIAGYTNGVYALKYISDVNWGTMRKPTSWTPEMEAIYARNRKYLSVKHSDYFNRIKAGIR
jgi:hypothetical protein